jgi:hypothetical protein
MGHQEDQASAPHAEVIRASRICGRIGMVDAALGLLGDLVQGLDLLQQDPLLRVFNADGGRLLSRRVAIDEPELLTGVMALGEQVTWVVNLADGVAR